MRSKVALDAGLVCAGALLVVGAVPPLDLWQLGLFAWLPLATIAALRTPGRAFVVGWLQGALVQGAVLWCLPAVLRTAGGSSLASSYALGVLMAFAEGFRFGIIALIASFTRRSGAPLVLVFPCAVVCAERFIPMVFPWTTALFVNQAPVLLQTAEVGGPWLVSFWLATMDASIAHALTTEEGTPLRDGLLVPAAILAVVVLFGTTRMRAIEARAGVASTFRVGVVQGDVGGDARGPGDSMRVYRDASVALLRREPVDVLVWPELAIDQPMSAPVLEGFLRRELRSVQSSTAHGVHLVTGVALTRATERSPSRIRRLDGPSTPDTYLANAAILALPDGLIRGIYEKRTLVPFGESVPLADAVPWLRSAVPRAGAFTAGSKDEALVVDGHSMLPRICLEDMLPEHVRRAVAKVRPEFLVSLTSNSWFRGSRTPALHLAIARLRAVEHRRYLLQATSDGMTALVGPTGKIVSALRPDEPGSMIVTAAWLNGTTWYERVGDSLCWMAASILVVCNLRRRAFA